MDEIWWTRWLPDFPEALVVHKRAHIAEKEQADIHRQDKSFSSWTLEFVATLSP